MFEKKYLLLFAIKLIEKIADPSNGKEYYSSYLTRKILFDKKKQKIN